MGKYKKWSAEDIPFKIERSGTRSLTDQLTDGVRDAIASGQFKAGVVLPTIVEWANLLNVSIRVPEAAVAALVREGLITARKRVGCVVAPKRIETVWCGRVVAVVPDGDHVYYQNVLVGRLRARVAEAGYLFSQTTVIRNSEGNYDTRQLRHELAARPDFVLLVENRPDLERLLSESGVAFGVFGNKECTLPGCVANFHHGSEAAVALLAEHCRRVGVKRALQVTKSTGGTFDALAALQGAGVEVETFTTPVFHKFGRAEGTTRGALAAFRSRFASLGSAWLPELVVFTGDYVASGALVAMQEAGVRIPDDVKVVSLANKGLGPVFPVPLTRIENDPMTHGDILAGAVCAFLRGKSIRRRSSGMGSRYIVGESFPA